MFIELIVITAFLTSESYRSVDLSHSQINNSERSDSQKNHANMSQNCVRFLLFLKHFLLFFEQKSQSDEYPSGVVACMYDRLSNP